MSKLKLEK